MQTQTAQPIAYLWKTTKGWLVELKPAQGWDVMMRNTFASKREAKDFAKQHNATPWNY